jgi:hypothetical protein
MQIKNTALKVSVKQLETRLAVNVEKMTIARQMTVEMAFAKD